MATTQTNKKGQSFQLFAFPNQKTEIWLDDKVMVVNAPLIDIKRAWYQWVWEGDSLQNAFNFLTPGERRFIDKGEL